MEQPHSTCTSHIEAIETDIEDVTAHIETATSHIEAATSHTAPGAIKYPFEPTATTPEKMAKPFLNSRFRKRVIFFGSRVNCLGNLANSAR